jgi:hypothetical protein
MSSMPEREGRGQPGSSTGQSAPPGTWGAPQQPAAPGQEGGWTGPESAPSSGVPAQPSQRGQYSQPVGWAGQPGSMAAVSEAATRVTWRRIFQYWIDAFFVSVIPYLVSIPFDRSGSTIMRVIGGLVYVVLFVLIGLWYWVIRPHSRGGQTFAMKWFGLRVISKGGGHATMTQLFIRWISLLL